MFSSLLLQQSTFLSIFMVPGLNYVDGFDTRLDDSLWRIKVTANETLFLILNNTLLLNSEHNRLQLSPSDAGV